MLRPRSIPLTLPVSVVVPCVPKHVDLLPDLLASFARQTVPPDELILALSGCAEPALHAPFPMRATLAATVRPAAANRNRGLEIAAHRVVIFHDADDLPHPRRIEIIRSIFERYEVAHLMHAFDESRALSAPTWPIHDSIESIQERAYYQPRYVFDWGLTNGNVAVDRDAIGDVRWPEHMIHGEDVAFNTAVCARSGANVVLPLPLLLYRRHLSATGAAP